MMTRGLPEDAERRARRGRRGRACSRPLERGGALALGPGLGRSDGAFAFARRLAREAAVPLVLDADGLNAHAGRLGDLAARRAPTVLTPHAGELGRLLGMRQRRDRARAPALRARGRAEQSGAVVVLKGDDSSIAAARRARGGQPRRQPGARHRRHRRRAHRA